MRKIISSKINSFMRKSWGNPMVKNLIVLKAKKKNLRKFSSKSVLVYRCTAYQRPRLLSFTTKLHLWILILWIVDLKPNQTLLNYNSFEIIASVMPRFLRGVQNWWNTYPWKSHILSALFISFPSKPKLTPQNYRFEIDSEFKFACLNLPP